MRKGQKGLRKTKKVRGGWPCTGLGCVRVESIPRIPPLKRNALNPLEPEPTISKNEFKKISKNIFIGKGIERLKNMPGVEEITYPEKETLDLVTFPFLSDRRKICKNKILINENGSEFKDNKMKNAITLFKQYTGSDPKIYVQFTRNNRLLYNLPISLFLYTTNSDRPSEYYSSGWGGYFQLKIREEGIVIESDEFKFYILKKDAEDYKTKQIAADEEKRNELLKKDILTEEEYDELNCFDNKVALLYKSIVIQEEERLYDGKGNSYYKTIDIIQYIKKPLAEGGRSHKKRKSKRKTHRKRR